MGVQIGHGDKSEIKALNDRPEDRDQDPGDILRIIQHYFDYNYDEILEKHNDIFPETEIDELKIAARVLGREARKYLNSSKKLESRVLEILHDQTTSPQTSDFLKKWAMIKDWDLSYAEEILTEFKTGITE